MILSITLFSIGVCCYAMHELTVHGKIRWSSFKNMRGFWGEWSYDRKYKLWMRSDITIDKVKAPNNWYYRLIGVKYKERWPTSTWLTVAFTDAPHMLQFFYSKLFILSIVLYSETYSWWVDGLVYLGVWYLTFSITYKVFSR